MYNKINKIRVLEFDILRTLACLMVIAMHSPMSSENANGLFLSSLSYLSSPCIGLFFMISGSLLLPITNQSEFFNKRLSKVLLPTIFWSLFYVLLKDFGGEFNFILFLRHCASIPFTAQGNGVLWFMYTLVGIYLVTPILSKWIECATKKEIEFYLIIWTITLFYPLFCLFLDVNKTDTGILYYFSGYLGYYILGFYLSKYRLNNIGVFIGCVIAVSVPVLCKILHLKVDFYELFWYLSIFVAIQCVGWYQLIFKLCQDCTLEFTLKKYVEEFSNLSFGIYFVHIFIMRSILWNLEWIKNIQSYIFQSLIIFLFTTLLSYLICKLISYLPNSDIIIGYKRK